MQKIDSFRGKHHFLSNFHDSPLTFRGLKFLNAEAAFQSAKTNDVKVKQKFGKLTPDEAKYKGRRVKLIPEWESVKNSTMYEVIKCKFMQNEDLKQKLLDTGDAELIEGNTWNDTYWGMCNGKGRNELGKALMRLREAIRSGAVDRKIVAR